MNKLLKYSLGGVPLEISVPEELHEGLTPFLCRMAPFTDDVLPELRMVMLNPKPKAGTRSGVGNNKRTKTCILNVIQKGTVTKNNELMLKAVQHLKLWLSDSGIYDYLKAFVCIDDKFSVIFLDGGILFVNLSIGEALLLLDEKWSAKGSINAASWWPAANITAVNAVMAFLSIYLAERGDGIVAHGIGMSLDGKGFLFLAPSGGGKTTLSIHSAPGSVLADDGIIIRENRNQYRIYPTPFRQRPGGEIKKWAWQQLPMDLRAVFILDKGLKTRIKSISRFHAMGFLVNAFTHFFIWMKPEQTTRVLDFWLRLGTKIPVAGIEWRLKSDFWPVIDDYIIKGKNNENQKRIPALAG